MIFRVFPENISRLWTQIGPLLAKPIAMRPTHSDEDVRLACMGGAAHLWMQWNEPTVEAALVTDFAVYPRGMWLRIWLNGALPGVKQAHHSFRAELEKWRQVHGCKGFELGGRAGWARLFPEATVEGLLMRWTEGPNAV